MASGRFAGGDGLRAWRARSLVALLALSCLASAVATGAAVADAIVAESSGTSGDDTGRG